MSIIKINYKVCLYTLKILYMLRLVEMDGVERLF